MPIRLPVDKPTGHDYEDFVASVLRGLGYFIETRVTLRGDTKEVLELDVVATPSGPDFRDRILVEAKNTTCRFNDMFKLFGQRTYLGIDQARLVYSTPIEPAYRPDYERVGGEVGVHPVLITLANEGEIDTDPLAPQCTNPGNELLGILAGQGWFHLIGQRYAYAAFNEERKEHRDEQLLARVRDYGYATQQAFFRREPLDRVRALYEAFQSSPGLTGECVAWAAERGGIETDRLWERVRDWHQYPWIQHVMLLEHKARNAIVKNALDHQLQAEAAGARAGRGGLLATVMPASFEAGMAALADHPHRLRIPYLFQVFVETFGGFLGYRNGEELEFLGAAAEIPPADVVEALRLIDAFFPPSGGTWFFYPKDELMCMKMIPGFVRGCGAFIRQTVYGEAGLDRVFPEMGWLVRNWHRALYRHLEPELAVPA